MCVHFQAENTHTKKFYFLRNCQLQTQEKQKSFGLTTQDVRRSWYNWEFFSNRKPGLHVVVVGKRPKTGYTPQSEKEKSKTRTENTRVTNRDTWHKRWRRNNRQRGICTDAHKEEGGQKQVGQSTLGNQDNMIQSTRPTPEADNYQTKIGNSLIVDTGLQ